MKYLINTVFCLVFLVSFAKAEFKIVGPFATSDNAILNQATLQDGASFYVHHGSASTMEADFFVGSLTGASSLNVLKAGDIMSGQLTNESTITVQGAGFSVGGSTLVVSDGELAIRVSDLVVKSDGKVGIGTAEPSSQVEIYDTDYLLIKGKVDSNTSAKRTMFIGAKARSGPAAVQADDYLVSFLSQGYDSSGYDTSAQIDILASETWTDTAHGSYITLHTVDNTTTLIDERMRIEQNGYVGIGTTTPNEKLHIKDGSIELSTTTGSQGIIFQTGNEQTRAWYHIEASSKPSHTSDIASTNYVGLSTVTLNNMIGGLSYKITLTMLIDNDTANRIYTMAFAINGVIQETVPIKVPVHSTHMVPPAFHTGTSPSGNNEFSFWIKSDDANNTQTCKVKTFLVEEYRTSQ